MSIISESIGVKTQIQSVLDAGLDYLSNVQTVTFQEYIKFVMPLDKTVYWVKSQNAPFQAKGSLHLLGGKRQEVDKTVNINKIIFTSQEKVASFNTKNSQSIFISQITDSAGVLIQAAFSEKDSFYNAAKIWHYSGDAVYPSMASQIINSYADLPLQPIVSNSLPLFTSLNKFSTVYPSFLLPENLNPPYIVIDIINTEALAGAPIPLKENIAGQFSSNQLMKDTLEITLYGLNNQKALQYLNYLEEQSLTFDRFGFCSIPTITEEKETQRELGVIAIKKKLKFTASYYQSTVDGIYSNLIKSAIINIETNQNKKEV